MQAGGGWSAGEERRAARLIFQVSGCRREGIGDGVQAGGGAGVQTGVESGLWSPDSSERRRKSRREGIGATKCRRGGRECRRRTGGESRLRESGSRQQAGGEGVKSRTRFT